MEKESDAVSASTDGTSPPSASPILVTGAAGFLGSHLCEALVEAGHQVWGLDNFHPYYDPRAKRRNLEDVLRRPEMHLVEGDIRDGVLLDGLMGERSFGAVVHLAALPGVRTSLEAPDVCLDINIDGTVSILEAAGRHRIGNLVFASSSSVYGEDAEPPFRESDAADRPISPYAASKRAGEMLCHAYHATHGLSVHCLRIFTAYGPRQRPDLAIHKFARLMRSGEPLPLYGDGSSERDYTYVDDVVEGIRRSIERLIGRTGESEYRVVNLGRGETVRLDELVRSLSAALGIEPEIERMPEQPGDVTVTHAAVDRARELLGWSPRTSLEDGLAAFVRWLDEADRAPVSVGSEADGSRRGDAAVDGLPTTDPAPTEGLG
mgnify:CR=1 FL=1